MSLLRRVGVMAAVCALAISSLSAAESGRRRVSAPTPEEPKSPRLLYTESNFEYYLTDDGIAYIRPGVKIVIVSVADVAPGKKPVVEYRLTDNFDQPLDRLGKVTPGPIAPGFILSQWIPETREYKTLTTRTRNGVTRPSGDQGGTTVDLEMGRYRYTFGTTLPTTLDTKATYTLGIYARRTLSDIIGKDYYADNVYKEIRPDGGTVGPVWNAMVTATTCNRCHDPLGLHGGTRRDVKNCMLCHNEGIGKDTATGEDFDGKVMFHKLHNAAHLPSGKEYIIAGANFTHITYPQVSTISQVGVTGSKQGIILCDTCHEATGGEKDIWYTRPSRAACGSCHDNINWTTGAGHVAGPATDDSKCSTCHVADSGTEWDASIKGAHTNPYQSKQLKGLNVTIENVTDMVPGKKPTVTFKMTNNDKTAVDGTKLATFAPILAGPTSSYTKYWRENGVAVSSNTNPGKFDPVTGLTTYTFTNAIPADAKGSWSISGDFYRNVNLKRGDSEADVTIREAALNPVKYYSLSGGTAEARRTVVTMAQCNACHDDLALHGTQRKNIDECVICHNPVENDRSRRPASAGTPETVSMQYMIHKIHTGEELNQDYTVYGFGGTPFTFNEVVYPGDRRNCAKCHTNNSHRSGKGDPVVAQRDFYQPLPATTAACLSCHDSRDAYAHAYLNTTTFQGQPAEACGVCHGPNADLSPDRVHAR